MPGNSVDDTFAGTPPYQREAYDAIVAHLRTLGPLHLDAVQVGVFLLAGRKFAEVRPMARSLSVSLALDRRVAHPRINRQPYVSGDRVWNNFNLTSSSDVNGVFLELLTEAYLLAAG